jgi:hypothetical protein
VKDRGPDSNNVIGGYPSVTLQLGNEGCGLVVMLGSAYSEVIVWLATFRFGLKIFCGMGKKNVGGEVLFGLLIDLIDWWLIDRQMIWLTDWLIDCAAD